jgi:FkbM family methyltransferase
MSWTSALPARLRSLLIRLRTRGRGIFTFAIADRGLEEHFEKVRQLLQSGDHRRAERILRRILRTRPRAPNTTYLLGISVLLQGRFGDARRIIDRAYSLRPWVNDGMVASDSLGILLKASASLPDWDWPRYQLARERWHAVDLTISAAVAHLSATGEEPLTFVQIGANDGKRGDPMHSLVRQYDLRGLLVEPQQGPFRRLRRNYADVDGLIFENVAIAEDEGPIEMTTTARHTLGTMVPDRNILQIRPKRDLEKITVTGRQLGPMLLQHGIERFDILQIDTEGYDYRVLRQVDLAARNVTIVNMEFYCLPVTERLAACAQLDAAGFAVFFGHMDLLAVKRDVFAEPFRITDLLQTATTTE